MNYCRTNATFTLNSSYSTQNYSLKETRYRIPKIGAMIAVLCLSFGSLYAQHSFGETPTYWVRSNDMEANLKVNESEYLANYTVLDLSTGEIQNTFKKIAKENHGTLFIAGRFPDEERLITFGKIMINNHHAEAGQHDIDFEALSGDGSILKVSYNISPKYKKGEYEFYIHEDVQIAELLFFKNGLSEEESRKVESYLALKYSVNITQNTNNELRHYVNPDDSKVWDFPSDALYNQEVIGLGRCDDLMFYQTQTYSANAKEIQLAFTEGSRIGEFPQVALDNNSYLILSKKTNELTNVICGGSTSIKPWKLSLHNWSESNPHTAYLWLDTIPNEELIPVLTDGYEIVDLTPVQKRGGYQLTLPLGELDFTQDYYIVWNFPDEGCDPLANMQLELCNEALNLPNKLTIEVEDEGISSQIILHNQTNGEQYHYDLYQNIGEISGLPLGNYELIVTHNNVVLINELFKCDQCDGVSSNGSPSFSQSNKENGGLSGVNATQGVRAYPNPVGENSNVLFQFWGFESQEFEIQISDQTGKTIDIQSFQLIEGGTTWSYQFRDVGVYNVRISASNFIEVKRIIVQ